MISTTNLVTIKSQFYEIDLKTKTSQLNVYINHVKMLHYYINDILYFINLTEFSKDIHLLFRRYILELMMRVQVVVMMTKDAQKKVCNCKRETGCCSDSYEM